MSSASSPSVDPLKAITLRRFAFFAVVVAFLVVVMRTAWLSDDSLISFRSSLNLANGLGLRWNADERVQSFTNPLWTLLCTIPFIVTSNPYIAAIPFHLILTFATIVILFRMAPRTEVALLMSGSLLLSKCFIDYSTSGLENSLSHVLVAALALNSIRVGQDHVRRVKMTALLSALLLVDRLDMGLLVAPTLGLELWLAARAMKGESHRLRSLTWALLVGLSPIILWEIFSVVYFGFPLPNTYFAKAGGAGFSKLQLAYHGVLYLYDSLLVDPVTPATVVLAIVTGLMEKDLRRRALVVGILLHILYLIDIGGDFMSGRLLSPLVVLAACMLADFLSRWEPPGFATRRETQRAFRLMLLGWCAVIFIAEKGASFPTLEPDGPLVVDTTPVPGVADERHFYFAATGLRAASDLHDLPNHPWAELGKTMRDIWVPPQYEQKVAVLGPVGMTGFYAGPEVHIVDYYALTDPLLARLPIPDAAHETRTRTGHNARVVPHGYVETLQTGMDRFTSRPLAEYYKALQLVVSGPLFSEARWEALVDLNTGGYNDDLEAYMPEYNRKPFRISELKHEKDTVPNYRYGFWKPCADEGVAFTNTGLELDVEVPSTIVNLHITPGDYWLEMYRGFNQVGKAQLAGGDLRAIAYVPFDRITIDPLNKDPEARFVLTAADRH